MKVYISLPISGHDLKRQMALAEEIAQVLRESGHQPLNPFDSDEDGMTYGQYLGKDIALILDQADGVIFAQGWAASKGCQLERQCALLYGKQIAYFPRIKFKRHGSQA